ncbi:MAG: exo-alpha-sialidase, partial [Chitinophagaceae bacterium]
RKNGSADFGDIDIVLKRSEDGGRSWSPLEVIADAGVLQAGNPAPVVDRTDPRFPDGRIFLFYNTGSHPENEVRKGKGVREVWYKTSEDGGRTWSEGTNITREVHRPFHPELDSVYQFKEDWRSYAVGPGHALQLTQGIYRGRLFVPANHSEGPPLPQFEDYHAHGFYSDDHGLHFQLSERIEFAGSNEATAAETSTGQLILNMRNQKGVPRYRLVGISHDGGQSWDTVFIHRGLPDPVCQGSLLKGIGRGEKPYLAFSNPADSAQRNRLTVKFSSDEGLTWPRAVVIEYAEGEVDVAAYSDLIELGKQHIGLLYERDRYREIVFCRVSLPKQLAGE